VIMLMREKLVGKEYNAVHRCTPAHRAEVPRCGGKVLNWSFLPSILASIAKAAPQKASSAIRRQARQVRQTRKKGCT
jgi:hypothetical protein